MRARSLAIALSASTILSVAASAAPPPDSVLFAGYVTPKTVNSGTGILCMIDGANSTFLTSQTPVATLISFSDIYYTTTGSVGPTAYRVGGQARLLFAGGSTGHGRIHFDANASYPNTIDQPSFNGYSQNYNTTTHTLAVRFNILFPNCTLPIAATYRN